MDSGILSDNIKVAAMYDLIKKSVDHIYEGDKMFYAKDSTPKELDDFIDSLTGEQMRKIQGFFSSMPRLEHKIKVTNPNTKVESEVTLKGLTDFFRIALSHDSLENYYETNFALMQHHKYSLSELEEMIPWEREIYISLLVNYIKDENEKRRRERNK